MGFTSCENEGKKARTVKLARLAGQDITRMKKRSQSK